MKKYLPRILKGIFILLVVLSVLLLLFINGHLASLAEFLYPGSAPWVHVGLLSVEALAFLWIWRALFGRRRHLLLMAQTTPEERDRFASELSRRLRANSLIRENGLGAEYPPGQDEDAFREHALALLDAKADEEIRRNARRIFLATALSQNGKLDALIMFVSLCRMVWRVSAIYNQNPHPREVASLYGAVVTSAFLALSIEELDIPMEITVGFGEAFHAMAPAGLTASIPFAGKALQTFTASAIDGAANCYLGLRAGIITRNAYAYGGRRAERPSRATVYREAGALLMDMSQTLMSGLASTLADGLAGAAGYAGKKTVQAGKDVVGGLGRVGSGIGASAGRLATETASAVQNAGGRIAAETAGAVHSAGGGLAKMGKSAGSAAGAAAGKAASAAAGFFRLPFRRKNSD